MSMKIILANPRGFCAGVNMAIAVIDYLLEWFPDDQICVYHEIVHNRHVVDRFRHRGVIFIENVCEAPEHSILVFSAHGVSPQIREQARERNLTAIDATCPLVTKVHGEAIRYSRLGWQILLIGHANHQEVIGTMGEAPDSIQIVETPEDIPNLQVDDPEETIYLTQTTLSTDDAGIIIDALKKAFPGIKAPPSEDICYATTNRQHAVRTLAPESDMVLVVGSKNSSNSVRLTEIAKNVGTPARLIDDASELEHEWLKGVDTLLVTAGASAPPDLVNELVVKIAKTHDGVVEQWDIDKETVKFGMPGSLKSAMRKRGIKLKKTTIEVDSVGDLLEQMEANDIPFQSVDLTIGDTG